MAVRTRFAPSPTGFLHVGGVRTALFAWVFARQQQGQFILRIEDTDKKREVTGSIQHIKDSLTWLGIDWDEEYLQSDRLKIYQDHAGELITKGLAYVDTYHHAVVEDFRAQAKAQKSAFLFRHHRPKDLVVPDDWFGRLPLRFKVPEIKRYEWHDEVRGRLTAGEESLDDFVLVKADGFPTYNFAHVVDDHLMAVSHVMRGEEFIASVPKYLSLIEAFGWERPKMATLPPILNTEGGKKLSKRAGAKDVLDYQSQGYLPSAVVNFLASLGWNDGSDQEIYQLDDIVSKFSLERIQKSGAKFDETKLDWINWQHFKLLVEQNLAAALAAVDISSKASPDYLSAAAKLAIAKAANQNDFSQQMKIFTQPPSFVLDEPALQTIESNLEAPRAKQYLQAAAAALAAVGDWSSSAIEQALRAKMAELEAEGRVFLNLIRWAVSGQKVSPSLFDMLAVLGKEQTRNRLMAAVDR